MKSALLIGAALASAGAALYGAAVGSTAVIVYAAITTLLAAAIHERGLAKQRRAARAALRWNGRAEGLCEPELSEATFEWPERAA